MEEHLFELGVTGLSFSSVKAELEMKIMADLFGYKELSGTKAAIYYAHFNSKPELLI